MIALSDAHRLARLDRRLEWDDLNDDEHDAGLGKLECG